MTQALTRDVREVEKMFRLMMFNVRIGNKDDHSKNFSFMVTRDDNDKWSWRLAPAYDLTHSPEGYDGEHATSVNNTSTPTIDDFLTVGTKAKIPPTRCRELYKQVRDNLQL